MQVVIVGAGVVLLRLILLMVVFLSLVAWGVVGINLGLSGLAWRRVELDVHLALHTARGGGRGEVLG